MYNTYIPLLTYAHANGEAGSKVIPGLAKALPKISDDGSTYTLFLRHGPQVLRRHAGASLGLHRRDRTPLPAQLAAAPPSTPTSSAPNGSPKTKSGGIPGIQTDDASGEIVIHLTEPRGTFTNELGLLFVALLPPDTPDEQPDRQPAAGHRPLRDHRLAARARAGSTSATRSGPRTTPS